MLRAGGVFDIEFKIRLNVPGYTLNFFLNYKGRTIHHISVLTYDEEMIPLLSKQNECGELDYLNIYLQIQFMPKGVALHQFKFRVWLLFYNQLVYIIVYSLLIPLCFLKIGSQYGTIMESWSGWGISAPIWRIWRYLNVFVALRNDFARRKLGDEKSLDPSALLDVPAFRLPYQSLTIDGLRTEGHYVLMLAKQFFSKIYRNQDELHEITRRAGEV